MFHLRELKLKRYTFLKINYQMEQNVMSLNPCHMSNAKRDEVPFEITATDYPRTKQQIIICSA